MMCYYTIRGFWVAVAGNCQENHSEELLKTGGLVTHPTTVQSL